MIGFECYSSRGTQTPSENSVGTAGWGGAGNSTPEELGTQSLEKTQLSYREGSGPNQRWVQGHREREPGDARDRIPLIWVTWSKGASVCSLIQWR